MLEEETDKEVLAASLADQRLKAARFVHSRRDPAGLPVWREATLTGHPPPSPVSRAFQGSGRSLTGPPFFICSTMDEIDRQWAGLDDAEFEEEQRPEPLPIPEAAPAQVPADRTEIEGVHEENDASDERAPSTPDPYAPPDAAPVPGYVKPWEHPNYRDVQHGCSVEDLDRMWEGLSDGMKQHYTECPWLFKPSAPGHPVQKPRTAILGPKQANRVNVREVVKKLTDSSGLDPISVMTFIMMDTDEARAQLGLRGRTVDRVTVALRAKCAKELLSYMAPKLKAVEVKGGGSGQRKTTHVFLPKNEREQGQLAEQEAVLILPDKDGQIQVTNELVRDIVGADEEHDGESEYDPGGE